MGTTTTFSQALAAQRVIRGPICSVHALLAGLPAAERSDIQTALDDPTIAHAVIDRALRTIGHDINVGTVARHRKHDCMCER